MIEVFPLIGLASEMDDTLNRVALVLLVFLFLVSLGFFALQRFEGFQPEARLNQLIVFGLFISLWPHVMMGIKELVDSFNTFLLTDIFHIQWNGFEAIGSIVWEKVKFDHQIEDYFLA